MLEKISLDMSEKSIVQEVRDIKLAMELIALGARLQMLESVTQLSRGRLTKLYKELCGSSPPKGMLPYSTEWFMKWEHNIHASVFCNFWQYLLKTGLCSGGVDAVLKAYKFYLEQCLPQEDGPLLTLIRAWTLVRFVESGMLELSRCDCCEGNFITYTHEPAGSFVCSLCKPPSRIVVKRRNTEGG